MYNKTKELNDIAVKRLDAIKEFTELGSGYALAVRDLSIRGAGDILGAEQSASFNYRGTNQNIIFIINKAFHRLFDLIFIHLTMNVRNSCFWH